MPENVRHHPVTVFAKGGHFTRNPVLRCQIAIIFCLIQIISAGCATSHQKVDTALLEQNKGKTFKLGIVKAAVGPSFDSEGSHYGPRYIEHRKKALENIPVAEICSILTRAYPVAIDANVDKSAKVVKENKAAIEASIKASDPANDQPSEDSQGIFKGDTWRDDIYNLAFDVAFGVVTDIISSSIK
jgi:hypothetical protein